MSKQQYLRFYDLIGKLIVADQSVDIFEWVAHRVLTQELCPLRQAISRQRSNQSANKVQKQVGLVLSLLATLSAVMMNGSWPIDAASHTGAAGNL